MNLFKKKYKHFIIYDVFSYIYIILTNILQNLLNTK